MADKSVDHSGHRQRMKERLLRDGLESFQPHEMMEMLLYYALPYRDTNPLGHKLMQSFGSVSNVLSARYEDLLRVDGVTPHVATLLTLCGQMAHQYIREQYAVGDLLYSTNSLGQHAMPWFVGKKEESVILISMDNKRKHLNTTRIFEGSVNSAQFNYRIAVQQALRDNATVVALAHNHPNGLALPSESDLHTTEQFAKVLALVGIRLVDHLVISDGDFVSMADSREMAALFSPSAEIADPTTTK